MIGYNTISRGAAASLYAAALFVLAHHLPRQQFAANLAAYAVCFAAYLWLANDKQQSSFGKLSWIVWFGIGLRGIAVSAFPQLSDDIYRFIWDGHLLKAGINPFLYTPTEWLSQQKIFYQGVPTSALDLTPDLNRHLYQKLNSPDAYTVYPPLAQLSFWLGTTLFPQSWYGSALVIKSFVLAAELGTLWVLPRLLRRWQLPEWTFALYWLNPLLILEGCGNAHHEPVVLFFLFLMLWLASQGRWLAAGLAATGSIIAKLLPLMFMPFLIRRWGWKRAMLFFGTVGMGLLLCFAPLLDAAFWANIGSSLQLYMRQFEFNGSLYRLFRWLGYRYTGYNPIRWIGPLLAVATLLCILLYAWREKRPGWQNLPHAMLFAVMIYLLHSPTVHPWYTLLPLGLCILTPFRFPIVWSGLVFLTYATYRTPAYIEPLWLETIEYALVLGYLAWELWRNWRKPMVLAEG